MDSFDARQATLDLVTAFVNNNSLKAQELPSLLSDVYSAIAGFGDTKAEDVVPPTTAPAAGQDDAPVSVPGPEVVVEAANEEPKVAVSIEQSLADRNYILSMITGERLKTLARHLKRHGLDPEQYRARYRLPKDYPMVAPAYSELRRAVAKKMALGTVGRAKPANAPAAEPAASVQQEPAKTEAKAAKAPVSRKAAKRPAAKSKPDDAVAQLGDTSSVAAASEPAAKRRAKTATKKTKAGKATGAEKPANPGDQTESSAAPSIPPAIAVPSTPAPRKARAQASATASSVQQKADGAVATAPKARRAKLKPVFNG